MVYDRKILSIDSNDDDGNYQEFEDFFKSDSQQKKKLVYLEIEQMGSKYLDEIERKKRNDEIKKSKLIPYILSHSNQLYEESELMSYSYRDILEIYNQIRKKNRSIIAKIFYFIFNFE